MNPRRTILVALLCIGLGVLSARTQNLVTNGDFSNGTNGWSFSGVHVGQAQEGYAGISSTGGGYAQVILNNCQISLSQSLSTVVGDYYQITFGYVSVLEGGEVPYVPFSGTVSFGGWSTNFNYTNYVLTSNPGYPPGVYDSSPQQFSFVIQATNSTSLLDFSAVVQYSLAGFANFGLVSVIPTIPVTQQPQSTNVIDGCAATFSLTPGGSPPYTYQWWTGNGVQPLNSLAGQTNNVLTIPSVTSTNAGDYYLVFTSDDITVTSAVAVLNVYVPALKYAATNGNRMNLSFVGATNFPYVLQSASGLMPPANWQPVTTNYTDSNGNWTAAVTNSQNASCFFQAIGP